MSLLEIGQAANPLLTCLPIVLMILSGYAVGKLISFRSRKSSSDIVGDLIYGNVAVAFAFLAGFIIFGVLTFAAKEYFTIFTYITGGLAIFGAYLLLKKLIVKTTQMSSDISKEDKSSNSVTEHNTLSIVTNNWKIFTLFGIALVASMLIFHAIIIYYHPIFSEYDSMYLFLPISKSIILGNGLNHDYYLGSDVNMRYPPFTQAMNAWLIQSFEYSSVRLFPIYYLFLATVLVYSFARNIIIKSSQVKESSFLSLIACSAFLITPAVLVVSSRFSLQQDIGFIFILTASFYFLSDIVRSQKPPGTTLLMLSASLALMALTREVGTVISIAIFFLVPAIKFTENNLKLRTILIVLSFLPLYLYYFVFYGAVEVASGLLLVLSNIAVFFILFQLKYQNKFSSLTRPVFILYISPIVIPAIFLVSNIIMFNGVYPGIVFSDKFYEIADIGFGVFASPNDKQGISDIIEGIPRLDVLFTSVAMGSAMIFFKLLGIGRLIYHFKNNYQYSLVLILVIFLIVTWSFLLQSGFEISNIRHVLYFAPILSVIIIMGMKIGYESSNYWKLYYYGVIVFTSYYVIVYNLVSLNSNNFVGLFIDPNKSPIITIVDLVFAALLISPLIIPTIRKIFSSGSVHRENSFISTVLIVTGFSVLFLIQIYVLGSSGANLIPLEEKEDQQSPPGWEHSVFDVINYLQEAEQGNVLSVRAPSIPFFTNRTNYDLFNTNAFVYSISDLLSSNTTSIFKNGMSQMGIRYIILPNEQSDLYYAVENLTKSYPILRTLSTDKDFDKLSFKNFNLYKYTPSARGIIDLIDENHIWKSFGQTTVVQSTGNLIIAVGADKEEKIYNRAYLQTTIKLSNRPLLLSVASEVETKIGEASYPIEIRDAINNRIIFNSLLNNTAGNLSSQTFLLPPDIVNKPLEFRVYIVTDGPGQHAMSLKKVTIMYT